MKFQWYVINVVDCTVKGTNDVEQIIKYRDNSDYILLTGQHGLYFNGNEDEQEVDLLEDDGDDDKDEDSDEDDDEDDGPPLEPEEGGDPGDQIDAVDQDDSEDNWKD